MRLECARAVAVFDRERGIDALATLLAGSRRSWWAAAAMLMLGDARGIPTLIDELAGSGASLAYSRLRQYTQEDLPNTTGAWRDWWSRTSAAFVPKTGAARVDLRAMY
jgi:hypothetical protein